MTQPLRVLLVEDSNDDAVLAVRALREGGFEVDSKRVETRAGLESALDGGQKWDLVLADYTMPQFSGTAALKLLRERNLELPFIFVSGTIGEDTAVAAMKVGAYDYVLKGRLARLVPSVQRALREADQRREKQRVVEALRESEERYALAALGANDGLWDWNLNSGEVYYSTRWKEMLGFAENEIADKSEEWLGRVHPDDRAPLDAALHAHLKGQSAHFTNEHRLRHRDGDYGWMLCRGVALTDDTGRAYRMAGSLSDVSERKRAEQQLVHDAFHDALTGLPNRALFLDRLERATKRLKRNAGYGYAVLFLDLDRFKVINDSLGHLVGDQLLVEVGGRLSDCLRHGDTVARLGGDEFAILLEEVGDIKFITHLAERVQQAVQTPFRLSDQEIHTTASIGVTLSDKRFRGPDAVLRDADTAMYRAKAKGKARYEIFDADLQAQAMALWQLESELHQAVEGEQWQLVYQPLVDLTAGKIVGFEALLRWQHPRRGLLRAGEFISVAEESGLIRHIGAWVLRRACLQLRAWQMRFAADPPLFVSVNLSSKQLLFADVIEQIERTVTDSGIGRGTLALELTESVLVHEAERSADLLRRLKQSDLRLFIDDFGTGYSSLSYLQNLPIDALKIAGAFVGAANDKGLAIARAITSLGLHLGMDVIAEGVETAQQLDQLRSFACHYGQGFLFAKPLDADSAGNLLAEDPRW